MKEKKQAGVSSEAVKEKTGKTWDEWFKILDKEKSAEKQHKEIAKYLAENFDIGGWWSQMITVAYEQARGMREKHQSAKGFQVSGSKTINISLKKLYDFFADNRLRKQWLDEKITIKTKNEYKNIRVLWNDNTTTLDVYFYPKDESKSQIVVNHNKIKNKSEAEKMKLFWKKALDKLKKISEEK